jgi:hypothetical protein
MKLNHAQMDAIMELYAEDNPKTFKFTRASEAEAAPNRKMAAWEGRLTGGSHKKLFGGIFDSGAFAMLQNMRNKKASMQNLIGRRTFEAPNAKRKPDGK